jgi:hypothetical protein
MEPQGCSIYYLAFSHVATQQLISSLYDDRPHPNLSPFPFVYHRQPSPLQELYAPRWIEIWWLEDKAPDPSCPTGPALKLHSVQFDVLKILFSSDNACFL